MKKWRVGKTEEGIKLLDFIQKQLKKDDYPNREIKRQIEAHRCQVNNVVEHFASRRLSVGDWVQFDTRALGQKLELPVFQAWRILFEDDALLIYNKPPGVSSDSNGILALLKPHGSYILVHRLDKDTSGVMILAKSSAVEEQLVEAFRKREVHKEYLALVDGCPKEIEGKISNFLGKVASFHGQTMYGRLSEAKGGVEAKTTWHLKKASKTAALLLCLPETGRTHQIRVHLSGMGNPILGDHQYSKHFRSIVVPPRMLLHAAKVVFKHPVTGKELSIEAPLPQDFQKAMKQVW